MVQGVLFSIFAGVPRLFGRISSAGNVPLIEAHFLIVLLLESWLPATIGGGGICDRLASSRLARHARQRYFDGGIVGVDGAALGDLFEALRRPLRLRHVRFVIERGSYGVATSGHCPTS